MTVDGTLLITPQGAELTLFANNVQCRCNACTHAQVVGEELSPGVKKGGYLNLIQRRVNCVGPASAIPKELELDVSSLDFGQRINMSGLNLPDQVSIAGAVR